jgi:hypothetical protein
MKVLKMFAAAAALVASAAQAQVIDFNELAHNNYYAGHQTIVSQGFEFTGSFGLTDQLGVWGSGSTYQSDPGYASVFINHGNNVVNMTHTGGGVFDFGSIDLSDVYNSGVSSTFRFIFSYAAGGSSTEDVTLDALSGLQTFTFNQAGLSSVSWQNIAGDSGWGQFDNVNVGVAQPVPEPETYALMLVGLGAVAWVTRRRRQEQN